MSANKNVDVNELSKFSALADQWWNPQGEMKPLHEINPLRLTYIEKHATLPDHRVLDMGCGGGLLAEALAKQGAHVTGIDMSDELIQVAKHHAEKQHLSIDYHCTSIDSFAESNSQSFDVVTCMELLEHVPDPFKIIQACAQLVKPNGKIFFSTINRNVKAFLLAIVGAEYIARLLPKGTHHYGQLIRPSELANWARQCHLNLIDITGIRYQLLTGKFSLDQDISVNYIACFSHE